MKTEISAPDNNVHRAVRAAFVAKGTSLNRWCRENGIQRQYADMALKHGRNGPKARKLRQRLAEAAGIELSE